MVHVRDGLLSLSAEGSGRVDRLRGGRVGRKGYTVVLTACIDPSGGPKSVVRSDPRVRLDDYSEALRFWLALPDRRLSRLVFIDNSGHPLDALQKIAETQNPHGKRVEFHSVDCNHAPQGLCYGYPGLAMLDLCLPVSELVAESEYFIKATGRLRFPAIGRLLDRLPARYDFAVDARDNTRFVSSPQRFITTQLMLFRTEYYLRELIDAKSRMSPELPVIETLFYSELMPHRGRPGAILRWPVNIDPVGHAAHWHKDYASPRQRIISAARAVARVVAPGWWI